MGEYNVYKELTADEELQQADQSLSAFHTEKASGNMGRLHQAISGFNEAGNGQSEEVSDGFSALQSVQPQNRVEQTLYDVLSVLYANATDLRTMNDGQVEQLRDIALRCPLDDGFAVHIARAALLSIDTLPKGYMNPCELVSPLETEKWKSEADGNNASSFAVYPNPNNGSMTVRYIMDEADNGQLEIFSILGQKVLTHTLNAGSGLLPIEMNNIPNGLYSLRIVVNGKKVFSENLSIIR